MELKRLPITEEEKDWVRGYDQSYIVWRLMHDLADDRVYDLEATGEAIHKETKKYEEMTSEICQKYNLIDPFKKETGTTSAIVTHQEWVDKLAKELLN